MTEKVRIRVFSVDDHPLVREGLAAIINDQPDMSVVAQASTGHEAIQMYRVHSPDVTLMDLRLPDISGIEAMIAIQKEFSEARFAVLTTFDGDVEVQRALQAGARGYILKSMSPLGLLDVIRQIHSGRRHVAAEVAAKLAEHLGLDMLTEREIAVLKQVAAGSRNRDIGKQLLIAEETVKGHMKHIMEKLRASDRTQAVAIGLRRGYIQL